MSSWSVLDPIKNTIIVFCVRRQVFFYIWPVRHYFRRARECYRFVVLNNLSERCYWPSLCPHKCFKQCKSLSGIARTNEKFQVHYKPVFLMWRAKQYPEYTILCCQAASRPAWGNAETSGPQVEGIAVSSFLYWWMRPCAVISLSWASYYFYLNKWLWSCELTKDI